MSLKRTCSETFRKLIFKEFPGLGNNEGHWRHLSRLLFAPNPKEVVIGQSQVARDYDGIPLLVYNNFVAIKFIEKFWREVYNYELIDYDYLEHRCRIAVVDFSASVIQLVQDELNGKWIKDKRLFISTGKVVNRKSLKSLRDKDMEVAKELTKNYDITPLAQKYQDYLNGLTGNRFSKLTKYIPQAIDSLLDKNEKGGLIVKMEAQKEQRVILHSILEQPQPFYIPTEKGNTVRLFEINKGLQGVHSHLRKILTQDWVEVDIQNAHLAIVAEIWNINSVKDFLKTGKSIWTLLLPFMGYTLEDKIAKNALKPYLYSAVYGMGEPRMKKEMSEIFGSDKYEAFIKHPIIEDVIKHRRERIKFIGDHKFYTTALGVTKKVYSHKDKKGNYQSNLTTILSQEANEYEMLLLEPILDLAVVSDMFDIVLYQFDGLSLSFIDRRRKRIESYLETIKDLVEQRAEELGIITTLTWMIPF